MGRKFQLLKECDRVLSTSRKNSPSTRKSQKDCVHLTVNQLIRLKVAPPSMRNLNDGHIFQLVKLWKSQKIQDTTIATRLSYLRQFFSLAPFCVSIPTNKDLKVDPIKKVSKEEEID